MTEALNAGETPKKRIGKPFQPGNPGGGRPKMPEELKEAFRELAPKALDTLKKIMVGDAKDSDKIKAAEVILDRGYGKATQPIDANLEGAIQVINVGVPAFAKANDKG